jgi:hypothetical protein
VETLEVYDNGRKAFGVWQIGQANKVVREKKDMLGYDSRRHCAVTESFLPRATGKREACIVMSSDRWSSGEGWRGRQREG